MSRESRENCSLLKEEVEGLRRKLERMQKTKEELVNIELEKEVNCACEIVMCISLFRISLSYSTAPNMK